MTISKAYEKVAKGEPEAVAQFIEGLKKLMEYYGNEAKKKAN